MPTAYRDQRDVFNELPPPPPSDMDHENDVESQNGHLHAPIAPSTSKDSLQVPVWLQESAKTFKYKWVPLPARKAARATVKWIKGPVPPRELRINPIYPKLQEAPIRILHRYLPKYKHRVCLLLAFLSIWFLVWSLMLKHLSTAGLVIGFGKPQNIWCGANFWDKDNGCGLNGNDCRPFSSTNYVFKCPANCLITKLHESRWVGNKSHQFTPLVVGGPRSIDPGGDAVYRGDSFICQAAIHAGVIDAATGGCFVTSLIGEYSGFEATTRNGVESFDFPSTFPRNFYFPNPSEYNAKCPADSRWGIFAVTAVALVLLSIFTTSPAAFFFGTFVIMFFHVGLVSDPPNEGDFQELLSTLASRLLPASFISVIMYRYCAVPLLTGVTAQVEKTVLYLGFCFLGALNNYTFAPLIPIQRLTPHDLSQPGAPFALAVVVTIIVAIVIGQVHYIRVSGNLPKYLAIYCTMGSLLIILLALPGQRLRIHHYILAMLFMPGTFTKTRACLAYQGLLLGLFVNGIARWGFASIIQTPAALGEVGGSSGSDGRTWWGAYPPSVTATIPDNGANITFDWGGLPPDTGIDGISILVNDVERWRGYVDNELYWDQSKVTLHRQRYWNERHEPEFYRFAWQNGGSTGRYSRPGVWDEDDTWHPV